jgi:integrase
MIKIKAIIKRTRKNKAGQTLVYIQYRYNNKRILFNTKVYTFPYLFNSQGGIIKKSENSELKNEIIEKKRKEIEVIYLQLVNNKIEPTTENVKKLYYSELELKEFAEPHQQKPKNLKRKEIDFIENYDIQIKKYIKLNNLKDNTLKKYNALKNILKEYQKVNNKELSFNIIDLNFFIDLKEFMIEKEMQDSTVNKYLSVLKTYMNFTFEENLHKNIEYQKFKISKITNQKTSISVNEIEEIIINIQQQNKFSKVLDLMLLGLSTGLRFSDILNINYFSYVIDSQTLHHLKESPNKFFDIRVNYLKVNTIKDNKVLKIPLNNFLIYFFIKYQLAPDKKSDFQMTNQVYNRQLKEMYKSVFPSKYIEIEKHLNNKKVIDNELKYKHIASHTMRRSFITIFSELADPQKVRHITGHSMNNNVFEGYRNYNSYDFSDISLLINNTLFSEFNFYINGNIKTLTDIFFNFIIENSVNFSDSIFSEKDKKEDLKRRLNK